jgi:membrane fusion protein (multidrug efflux system)
MNKKTFFSVITAAIIVCSCNDKTEKKPGTEGVKEYKTVQLEPLTATTNSDYPASIQGQENTEIRPKVQGYIEKIYTFEGAIVKKGQALFKISAPEYEQEVRTATASIQSAKAAVNTAKLAIQKVKPLVEKDIISKYELESAEYNYNSALATLAQANASLANAKTNLGYTTVTSPISGIVGSIPFREGSLVSATDTDALTTVSSVGTVYSYFAVNEKKLLAIARDTAQGKTLAQKIKNMPPVTLVLSDGSLYPEKGIIETVNGIIDTETGTTTFRARFSNPKSVLTNGNSATIRISDVVENAIIVPQSATFEVQNKIFVVTLGKDGKTKNVSITVSDNNPGNYYVVTEGLKSGDVIVLEGVATLNDGTQITSKLQDSKTIFSDLN